MSSSTRITTYQSLRIQLVQNASDDGPMGPEICRANISAKQTYSLRPHCVACWTAYILQDDTRSLQCLVNNFPPQTKAKTSKIFKFLSVIS